MGVLLLMPPKEKGNGDNDDDKDRLEYRLPWAVGEVFSSPNSKDFDISMMQTVPSLVNRAKTMLPEAFRTGFGRSDDNADITESIDRHHKNHIRDRKCCPRLLPAAIAALWSCWSCGTGVLMIMLANLRFMGLKFRLWHWKR